MKSCQYDGEPFDQPRSHPWTDAAADSECRYYDLKAEPALIRTALEDLVPWSRYAAVTQLYALLERINGPASTLESNDCAFSGPEASDDPRPGMRLQCEGRIMILYRELELNLSRERLADLERVLHMRLAELDREFEWGIVGTALAPVRYVTLPPERQLGHQLMLLFWAWGDSEAEAMGHLERVVVNLARAIGKVFPKLKPA